MLPPVLNATWKRICGQLGSKLLVPAGVLTCSRYAVCPVTVLDPAT